MTAMTKPTASQVWRRIVEEAGDDEIAAVLSLSQEEVDAELAGAGFDVKTERAKGEQFLEELVSGALDETMGLGAAAAPAPRVQPTSGIVAIAQPQQAPVLARPRRRPRTSMVVLFAAIAAAGAGGAAYVTLHHGAPSPSPSPPAPEPTPEPPPSPSFVPPQPDLVAAADWRTKAIGACDARKWQECLADLDIARAIDPDGDDTPAVKATRDRAIKGIVGKPPKPPTSDKP